jgi:hypothetical protein
VRLVRLGDETSTIGVDVRAALASWGRGSALVGGVALIGCQPPDCPEPVDAVVVLPRGLVVVVGVDLPDPAMRMDAPVGGQWRIDGWPLVREDGAVNPAIEGLRAVSAIAARLQAERVEPMPVGTVIAVGPYVSRVSQPTTDLARGVRILHPEPTTLLNAARELAVYERRCTVNRANEILAALAPDMPQFTPEDLAAEGFDPVAGPDPAAASTLLIPKLPPEPARQVALRVGRVKLHGWVPVTATAVLGLLLVTAIIVAAVSGGGSPSDASGSGPTTSGTVKDTGQQVVGGSTFTSKGTTRDTDCAAHAIGDMQVWLRQHPCKGLVRTRYDTTVGQDVAGVLVADITFDAEPVANDFLVFANEPGTGVVTDAAVNGVPWPDGRRADFGSAVYRTNRVAGRVRLVQVTWLDKVTVTTDPALQEAAARALDLPVS